MKPALILVMATCVAFAVPLLGQADNPSANPTEKNKYGPDRHTQRNQWLRYECLRKARVGNG
jgi:hypothetical protein